MTHTPTFVFRVTGDTGTNGWYKANDVIRADMDLHLESYAGLVTKVDVDYSELGGPVVSATYADGIWSTTWTLPEGALDTTGLHLTAAIYQDAVLLDTKTSSPLTCDNQIPVVNPLKPLILAGSSGSPVKVGHRVTLTFTNDSNSDIYMLKGDFSQFGDSVIQVTVSFQPSISLTLDPVPPGNNDSPAATVANIQIIDDAGNIKIANTNTLSVDNQPPHVVTADIDLTGDAGNDNVFHVGDTITVRWHNIDNLDLSSVYVDFTNVGGSSVAATLSSSYFQASYTLLTGAPTGSKTVSVRATDDAGYVVTASSPGLTIVP